MTGPDDERTADALSLQEAADALGVHYMTAYRYVRLGVLPARRNGRTWEVDRDELHRFTSERTDRSSGAGTRRGTTGAGPAVDWAVRLERRLMAGDRSGTLGVLDRALSGGSEPVDVYVDVIAPALRSLGERWANGEIDVAVEHRASVIASEALAVLGGRFTRRGVSRGVFILGAAPGERHSLPVLLVAGVVRRAGFEVDDLGADVPGQSFVDAASRADRLVAVGISATVPGNVGGVGATVRALRQVIDVPIFVGGAAIADERAAAALGADHWAPDARSAALVLDGVARERPGP